MLDVLLLAFAGLLLALFLHGAGSWIAKRLHVPERLGVAAVCLGLVGVAAGVMWAAAPAVATQIDELSRSMPKALERGVAALDGYDWARPVIERARHMDELLARKDTLRGAGTVVSSTFGAVGSLVVFLFIGLFVAFEPGVYRKGFLRLLPTARRERADEIMAETAEKLRMWMAGKILSMLIVGLATWGGLALLGVPLGLTLALLAALLTFVPNFGPVLSAIPAILLGLLDGPSKALYVGLLYVGVQFVESYILTPIVQKKTVSLPPALTIIAQVVMGTLAGGLGVLVASPLTAAALVIVKRVYVEDVLGDKTPCEANGKHDARSPAGRVNEVLR
jgi:predicted PurR-regulated permease PerM